MLKRLIAIMLVLLLVVSMLTGCSSSSSSRKSSREDDEEETPEGTYKLETIDGESLGAYLAANNGGVIPDSEYMMYSSYVFTLESDGTGSFAYSVYDRDTLSLFTKVTIHGTWTLDGNDLTCTRDDTDDVYEATFKRGKITMEMNGEEWVLTKIEPDAFDATFATIAEPDIIEPSGVDTPVTPSTKPDMRVALVTDYGSIYDGGYNEAAWQGVTSWCSANGVDYTYYQPSGDSSYDRVYAVDLAVADGYNVIVMANWIFGDTIGKVQDRYPDVKFIALDVTAGDLTFDWNTFYDPSINTVCVSYKEEDGGYLAGYAAVKLGYRKLGFLGGMAVPAVIRYGYGFVQGADQAAKELGVTGQVSVKFVYANQFFGDADITAYMNTWYASGTEVVSACGGGIYVSAAEAAKKVGGKIIGLDVDQAPTIGYDMTVTSAMKDLGHTVYYMLGEIANGNWYRHGGQCEVLGLSDGGICLSDSTQWNSGFTRSDYEKLVQRMLSGELTVSSDTYVAPTVNITVDYQGNIK